MLEEEMPPNMSAGGGKKKKKEKTAVYPVQQVQPQPHRPASPDFPPLGSEVEKKTSKDVEKQKHRTVLTVEPGEVTREAEKLLFNGEADLIDTSCTPSNSSTSDSTGEPIGNPVAPPRSPRVLVSPNVPLPSPAVVVAPSPSSTPRSGRERTPSLTYNKGQLVKPALVPASSIAASMAELVHEAMPSQQPMTTQAEKVEWVQFHTIERAGAAGRRMDLVLFGLARGFQLWIILENGDMEEVMSERQGPIRAFLPIPNIPQGGDKKDALSDIRPLVALVDAFSHVPDRQFCTVSIVSLTTKKVIRLPSATTAFEEPVCGLHSSERLLVISLSSRLIVYDTLSLSEIRSIRVAAPSDGLPPTMAINGQLLAFADEKLNTDVQSCGGLDLDTDDVPANYVSQAMNVAKAFSRTVASLGDSVSGAGVTKTKDAPKGIITVVDIEKEDSDDMTSVLAHWVAHMAPLSYCSWSPDGRLLLTADVNASCLNVFCVMPHPLTPSLAAVQHLYKLHRGSTAARVVSSAFSLDSRWLAVATNHGTTHVFAVCPYGGKPSNRTHGDHFTNKESRFLRSAGLVESSSENTVSIGRSRIHSGSNPINRDHPSLRNRMLARCSGNPRIGPYAPPVLLVATKKIRDPRISADNLSAWATDLTPGALSSSSVKRGRQIDLPRMSLIFSSYASDARAQSLMVARAETGVVCEYELKARQPANKTQSEEMPKLDVTPLSMWILQRTKNNPDIPAPLQTGSPFVAWTARSHCVAPSKEDRQWIPHVEMCTYSGPARRLWLGPQFSFFEYNEDQTADLVTPSESRHSLTSMKSIPVVIGQKSADDDSSAEDATRIECGSWVSQASIQMPDDGDISVKIADAMREVAIDAPTTMAQNSFLDDFSPSPRGASTDDEELLQFDDM